MNVIALDTETYLIEPGLLAPPLVCVSFATQEHLDQPGLLEKEPGLDFVENLLTQEGDGAPHIVIHNAAFDLAVFCVERPHLLRLVLRAYDEGRIHCTKVRDQMLLNARGVMQSDDEGQKTSFTLADLVKRRFNIDISESKTNPDAWRLRYGELDGIPLAQWPEEAKVYAKDDAGWHLAVYLHQEQEQLEWVQAHRVEASFGFSPLTDEPGQARAAFALHLMSMYGVLTDAEAVGKLEAHLTEVVEAANEKLKASGLLKGKSTKKRETGLIEVTWSKDTARIKALVEAGFAAQGLAVPRTDPSEKFPDGQVKMDEETLRQAGHPDLIVLADSSADNKLLTTYIPALKGLDSKGRPRGLQLPSGWLIQPGYNVLVSSGRTSAYSPNVQNPPRKGGVRECFVPRPGYWYCSVDYSFIELCTWAQTCIDLLGFSDLAEAIRAGLDPHVDMGVEILRAEHPARWLDFRINGDDHGRWSNEADYAFVNAARKAGAKWAKDARQLAKAANFGLPGGLGAATFTAYAKATYGVDISEAEAKNLKNIWRGKWREADAYFNHVSNLQGEAFGQEFAVTLPRTGFVRGGCTFTSGCNTYFQGLAARGAKEAMWLLTKACYLGEGPLAGSRPVLFLHDEFIVEVPAEPGAAHAAAGEIMRLMIDGMRAFVPDVPVACEPTLMKRWYKEAEPVYVNGMLVPWEPKTP